MKSAGHRARSPEHPRRFAARKVKDPNGSPGTVTATGSRLRLLVCRACCSEFAADVLRGPCPTCGHTLLAQYDLADLDGRTWWGTLRERAPGLWRYRELLPVQDSRRIATLGEPTTPAFPLRSASPAAGPELWVKDDGALPTGSFKARGMTVAVSRAGELGASRLFAPSAGNAGVALAAYGARAGLPVAVYLPERVDPGVVDRTAGYGAQVVRAGASIREAGAEARRNEAGHGFDVSTLREPYRVEGKKTMAFEIAEQFGPGSLPEAIVYPAGGGTGLVGLHKGFEELRALGLVEREPRLLAVQAEGCAPVVQALRDGAPAVTPWSEAKTVAPGLAVPAPFASERILEAVRASRGGGVTVGDAAIVDAQRELRRRFGIAAAIEAAATWAALPELERAGLLRTGERLLLYLTGRAAD